MIKAILFDLDGTLTVMDQEQFMHNYIGLLAPRFKHLIAPERFAKQVIRSIETTIKEPQTGKTNFEIFFNDFTKATGLSVNTLYPIFDEFYITDFPALQCLVKINPDGKRAVEYAKEKGYMVAVASNPVMPRRAIEERIRWAGLAPGDFKVVPAMETFHFCKPQLGFYEELAHCLGLPPQDCLMVGNHPEEDMVARHIGMKTFFVGTQTAEIQTDYAGDLSELCQIIQGKNL